MKAFMGEPTGIRNTNMCSAFDKLTESLYIPYNGHLIERTATGYCVFGEPVTDLQDAKGRIDKHRAYHGPFTNLLNSAK